MKKIIFGLGFYTLLSFALIGLKTCTIYCIDSIDRRC